MRKSVIEVSKNANENTTSIIRRFTKRVSNSGILRRARGIKFYTRSKSELLRKRTALRRIEKQHQIEKLKKLGKLADKPERR